MNDLERADPPLPLVSPGLFFFSFFFFSPGLQADLGRRRRRGRRRRSSEIIRVYVRVGWALQLQNKKPQSQVGLLLLASQLISSPSQPACLPACLPHLRVLAHVAVFGGVCCQSDTRKWTRRCRGLGAACV